VFKFDRTGQAEVFRGGQNNTTESFTRSRYPNKYVRIAMFKSFNTFHAVLLGIMTVLYAS
jgi:hypothetical protein